MLRKHASVVIAVSLVALVAGACIVRTGQRQRAQPVYVEKHKKQKDHHDNGKHKGHDKH
jgi:ABC-type nickel/cobalt efflux system permease component RcnA